MVKSLIKTLGILGTSLALAGCSHDDKTSLEAEMVPVQTTTNQISGLGITEYGYNSVAYFDNEKKLQVATGIGNGEVYKDLPNFSLPILVIEGDNRTIHVASNSSFKAHYSGNRFGFELVTPKEGEQK